VRSGQTPDTERTRRSRVHWRLIAGYWVL